ncbi:MAG: Gldg family protein [Acutalibacteraceae bacterium]
MNENSKNEEQKIENTETVSENTETTENIATSDSALSDVQADTDIELEEDTDEIKEQNGGKSKNKEKISKHHSPKNRRKKIFSLTTTALFLVALIIVNVICSVLTNRYAFFTADLTATQAFHLTENTIKLVKSINKPVEITFLSTKDYYESLDSYCIQTTGLATQYSQYSENITVNYVDITSNPTYANKYENETLNSTDVIISCGDKYRVLKYTDMYNMEYYDNTYQYIASSKVESAFDSALMTVTSDKTTNVTMIMDDAEENADYFIRFLESNNYAVKQINIATDKIPENTELLIMFTPTKDYTELETQSIMNFLTNNESYGKTALYIPCAKDSKTPNIDTLLEFFGMAVEHGMAFDMDQNRMYTYSYYDGLACSFASSDFTELINAESDYPVITSYSRSINIVNSNYASALLCLSSQSGTCPFDADENTWKMKDAVSGNVVVGAIGERGLSEEVNSHMVVMGSSTMFTKAILGSVFSNSRYVLAMLGNLCGNDLNVVNLADKVLTDYDLNMNTGTKIFIGTIFFAFLPLAVLGGGIVVFIKRRNQ